MLCDDDDEGGRERWFCLVTRLRTNTSMDDHDVGMGMWVAGQMDWINHSADHDRTAISVINLAPVWLVVAFAFLRVTERDLELNKVQHSPNRTIKSVRVPFPLDPKLFTRLSDPFTATIKTLAEHLRVETFLGNRGS